MLIRGSSFFKTSIPSVFRKPKISKDLSDLLWLHKLLKRTKYWFVKVSELNKQRRHLNKQYWIKTKATKSILVAKITPSYFQLWLFSCASYYAVQIDLSTVFFSTFFMDKLGKICRLRWRNSSKLWNFTEVCMRGGSEQTCPWLRCQQCRVKCFLLMDFFAMFTSLMFK